MRACIVHRDEAQRGGLTLHLERQGCDVISLAPDCDELEELSRCPPDLLLVDHPVPCQRDSSMLRHLHRLLPDTPLIAMLMGDAEDLAVDALTNGASNYLSQPVNERLLDIMVSRWKRRLEDEERHAQVLDLIVRNQTEIRIPSNPEILPCVVDYIVQQAEEVVRNIDTSGIRLGLEEILRNAVEHGNLGIGFELKEKTLSDGTFVELIERRRREEPYKSRIVRVECRIEGTVFRCTVEDEGDGFDHRKVWDPLSDAGLARLNGRGIFLTRTFFDSVTYCGRGNKVELVKDLAAETVQAASAGAKSLAQTEG